MENDKDDSREDMLDKWVPKTDDGDGFESAVTSAIQGQEASFDQQVTLIARAYADQVRADWDAFLSALAPDPNGAECVLR